MSEQTDGVPAFDEGDEDADSMVDETVEVEAEHDLDVSTFEEDPE